MTDRLAASPQSTPLRGMRRVLALVWVAGVVILYVAARELALNFGL